MNASSCAPPRFYLKEPADSFSANAIPNNSPIFSLLIGDRENNRLRPYIGKCHRSRRPQDLLRRLVFDTPYWRRRVDILILYGIAVINLVLLEQGVYSVSIPQEVTIFGWILIFWVFLLGVAYSSLQARFNKSLTNYAVKMCTHVQAIASNLGPALKRGVAVDSSVSVVTFVRDPAAAQLHSLLESSQPLGHVLKDMEHLLRSLPYAASVGFRNRRLRTELLPLPHHLHVELAVLTGRGMSCMKALVDMTRSRIGSMYRAVTISRQMQANLLELLDAVELSGARTAFWNYTRPISVFLRHLLTLSIYPSLVYLPFVSYRELGFVLSLLLFPLALIVLLGADELLNTLYDPFDTDADIINIGTSVSVWTHNTAQNVDIIFDGLFDLLLLWYRKRGQQDKACTPPLYASD